MLYPSDQIYKEMAFIGYYFHWSKKEIFNMPHYERVRWCNEISKINQKMNSSGSKKDDNPFSLDNFM